ncbi:MAG: diflavin flavoprotein [Leptolyngbyaceae cyanobacterium bins.59]|nr:diflavin flavoprotein [Leptolyngbyaceae cyanobacterium bins.59]
MVGLVNQANQGAQTLNRLTLSFFDMGAETTVIRSLDWDRERFDIEFLLNNGTTYNSFLIQAGKKALIDTSHRKFRQLYLDALTDLIDPGELDYLIVSHTEPDHSGLVEEVLRMAPQVVVVGSKVAIQFLENMVHCSFQSLIVKNGDRLDLGDGHELEFISAPNLHWPDTIFTYDAKSQILYTCDAFGMHYCDDRVFDEDPHLIAGDFRYYYDCLMGPNARSVLSALRRMEKLEIQTIATGHGPLLCHHLTTWVDCYREWSQAQAKTENLVALFYAENYGYSEALARSIAVGILRTETQVEMVDLNGADPHEVRELMGLASGFVIGMPSQSNRAAHATLNIILTTAHAKQVVGLFESGGGEDEPIYLLRNKFQEIGLTEVFPPIRVTEPPTPVLERLCDESGIDLGQWVMRDRTIKQIKALNHDLERALGRLSGGLYIITAQKNELSSAMVASWVMQVSQEPLGIAIAVAKDRAIESLLRMGDRFVLNVLEEGNQQALMKHFLKRFSPGSDRFADVKTYPAQNGSPILAEALAYLECEVTSRMECSDHWIVYNTVQTGRVAKLDALPAVHHRKVANHY